MGNPKVRSRQDSPRTGMRVSLQSPLEKGRRNPSLTEKKHKCPKHPVWRGVLLNGSCPWCQENEEKGHPLLPVSTLQIFLCAASSSPGCPCQSGQERLERWLLSTKSNAVPAEGVAHLTLRSPVVLSLPLERKGYPVAFS